MKFKIEKNIPIPFGVRNGLTRTLRDMKKVNMKTEKHYAFKLVYHTDGKLVSAVKNGRDNPKRVQYRVGKWAAAKKGQNKSLFVFDCLANARVFRSHRGFPAGFSIYHAEIKPVNYKPNFCLILPTGTKFATRVKLLKKVF